MTRGRVSQGLLTLLLVLLPLCLPTTGLAQPGPAGDDFFKVNVIPERGSVFINYTGAETIDLAIEDVSSASSSPAGVDTQVTLRTEIIANDTRGWQANLGQTSVFSQPGETTIVPLTIIAGATIQEPRVEIQIQATYHARAGEETTTNATVLAVAKPNPVVRMQFEGGFPEFRPDQRRSVPLLVTNHNYYPEMISFSVNAPEGWVVSPPSSVHLGPGETQRVFVDIKAPQDPWFRFNPTSDVVLVTAETQTNPGGRFPMTIPTPLSGWFLPGWVIPHILLLGLGLVVVGKRTAEKRREHRLEKGKPSFPGLPPEKEARYEALKVKDPERAEEMEDRLERLHKKRVAAWKSDYKERKREERERRLQAKKRHDAILEKKRKEDRKRREAERRKRKEMEKKRKKREKLRKKREKLEKRREQAQAEREGELAKEMRKEREARESRQAEESPDADASAEEKRKRLEALKKKKRLEELKRKKQALEGSDEDEDDGSS